MNELQAALQGNMTAWNAISNTVSQGNSTLAVLQALIKQQAQVIDGYKKQLEELKKRETQIAVLSAEVAELKAKKDKRTKK